MEVRGKWKCPVVYRWMSVGSAIVKVVKHLYIFEMGQLLSPY
jgi:hypothetical protein